MAWYGDANQWHYRHEREMKPIMVMRNEMMTLILLIMILVITILINGECGAQMKIMAASMANVWNQLMRNERK